MLPTDLGSSLCEMLARLSMATDEESAVSVSADATPFTTTWDDSDTTSVYSVVTAVATATGSNPVALPLLHDEVDADALNAMFAGSQRNSELHVTFRYRGCDVSVHGSGEVTVRPS